MARTRESVLCLSHLRWNFVFQRPQHLLSRCAREHDVVFFEEPVFDAQEPELAVSTSDQGVRVAVPHLAPGTPAETAEAALRRMVDRVVQHELKGERPVLWYYTPMATAFTDRLRPRAVVYDCMDELSLFKGAPAVLKEREKLLLAEADVVFTGGHSLYEHKRAQSQHRNIHPFPSSVDVPHFARARQREQVPEPPDQAEIPAPRVGFFGVIDERLDVELVGELAEMRPDLQIVLIGPVVKIDPADLPRQPNLHYLGGKSYDELPEYLAGWEVAILPFARNDSTRFISPTKTPEYLAAGKPVVSTSIRDVVQPYGRDGLAWIADTAGEFSAAIDEALASDRSARLAHTDAFLANLSWDRTWTEMWSHVTRAIQARASLRSSPLHAAAGATTAGAATAQPLLAKEA
jgi:glycosyltransferase involved in cell wall biosynthesis